MKIMLNNIAEEEGIADSGREYKVKSGGNIGLSILFIAWVHD